MRCKNCRKDLAPADIINGLTVSEIKAEIAKTEGLRAGLETLLRVAEAKEAANPRKEVLDDEDV